MLEFDEKYVENLTALDAGDQSRLARWYARASSSMRLKAHELQRSWSIRWGNEARKAEGPGGGYDRDKVAENMYAALLVSLAYLEKIEGAVAKGRKLGTDELELCTALRVERARATRARTKSGGTDRGYIINRMGLIEQLRGGGLSWRQIAGHAEFKGKMTAAWLHKVFNMESAKAKAQAELIRSRV
jgi:hypothetical protein